jgi:hypothetical protein
MCNISSDTLPNNGSGKLVLSHFREFLTTKEGVKKWDKGKGPNRLDGTKKPQ